MIRCALCRHSLSTQKKKKKSQFSKKYIKDYLEFAIAHQHWTIDDWSGFIFLDESKINCFCSNGMSCCWMCDSKQLLSWVVFHIVKHGGVEIIIWRSLSIHRSRVVNKIEDCIDQHWYWEIFKQNLYQTICKFHVNLLFVILQQDNACVHTTKILIEWFSQQCFTLSPWQLNFPTWIQSNFYGQFSSEHWIDMIAHQVE